MSFPLTQKAHLYLQSFLKEGDFAVDATAGNGHDTLFLKNCVGHTGFVLACDIQKTAIENTKKLLKNTDNTILIEKSHAEILSFIPKNWIGLVSVIMFNLGYLPGSSKTITTLAETTLKAIEGSFSILKKKGVISLLVYPGHPNGKIEALNIIKYLNNITLDFEVLLNTCGSSIDDKPFWIVLQKNF